MRSSIACHFHGILLTGPVFPVFCINFLGVLIEMGHGDDEVVISFGQVSQYTTSARAFVNVLCILDLIKLFLLLPRFCQYSV